MIDDGEYRDLPIPFSSSDYILLRFRYERETIYIPSIRHGKEKSFRDLPGAKASTQGAELAAQRLRVGRCPYHYESSSYPMITSRLADKDELIASLQRQFAEPPNDPQVPAKNDTGGVCWLGSDVSLS